MRIIRLLLPLLAVIGAIFSRRRNTPSKVAHTNSEPPPDPNDLVNDVIEKVDAEAAAERLLVQFDGDLTDEQRAALQRRREDILPVLLGVIANGKTHLREQAVRALEAIGGETARDALTDALSDYSFWVRGAAAESLGRMGDPAVVAALQTVLTDPEPYVRERAKAALEAIGGEEATTALAACADQPLRNRKSKSKKSRKAVKLDFELSEDYE